MYFYDEKKNVVEIKDSNLPYCYNKGIRLDNLLNPICQKCGCKLGCKVYTKNV